MSGILLKEGKKPEVHPVIWKCPKCKSLIAVYEAQVDSMANCTPHCPLCGTRAYFEGVWLHRKVCRLRYWWWTKVLRKPIDDCRKESAK